MNTERETFTCLVCTDEPFVIETLDRHPVRRTVLDAMQIHLDEQHGINKDDPREGTWRPTLFADGRNGYAKQVHEFVLDDGVPILRLIWITERMKKAKAKPSSRHETN